MPFGKSRKQKTPAGSATGATPPDQPSGPPRPPTEASKQREWLELARLEQQVAELAQVVARQHQELARLWEAVGDDEVNGRVRDIASRAWALERDVLQLVETALSSAEGEIKKTQ
jgi:hypothetical protein